MELLSEANHDRHTTFEKYVLKIVAALVIGGVFGSHAKVDAQQFGLNMGESTAQITAKGVVLKKVSEGVWRTSYLPYGNKAFDDYWLTISPKQGLCKITAWISKIQDSSYGDNTKSKFLSLKQALTQRYGTPSNDFDFLRAGAIWKEPNEWMWSISKKERTLASFWGSETNPAKNPVKYIALQAKGVSPEVALISVGYELTNASKCMDEIKNLDASNL